MAAPTNDTPPSITIQRMVGQTVTGTPGEWTGETSTALQWERAAVNYDGAHPVYDGANLVIDPWGEIGGATGTTHVLVVGDVRSILRLRETASNVDGSTIAYSNESLIIAAGGAGGFSPIGDVFRPTEEDDNQ